MKTFSLSLAAFTLGMVSLLGLSNAAHAQNLITNGDFTNGVSGFTSGYTNANPSLAEGNYDVVTNPNTVGWANYGDHTTGSGKMLLVNGGGNAATNFWQQTVSVLPNSVYTFSGWAANATSQLLAGPATVVFKVNGTTVGSVMPNGFLTTGDWAQFTGTWTSGSATTAVLSLSDSNTTTGGNDVTVDDLAFSRTAAVVPEANTVALLGMALPFVGFVAYARRKSASRA